MYLVRVSWEGRGVSRGVCVWGGGGGAGRFFSFFFFFFIDRTERLLY